MLQIKVKLQNKDDIIQCINAEINFFGIKIELIQYINIEI